MKPSHWQIIFRTSLIALSGLVYIVQIGIFKAPRDTFFYLFRDLAYGTLPSSQLISVSPDISESFFSISRQ